jgi:beta-N-acetylhexosaminidase
MLSRAWVVRTMVLASGAFAAGFVGWSALAEPDARPRESSAAAAPPLTPPAPAARAPVREDLARAVGQKIVTRMAGTQPSPRLLERVRRGRVGGVILFADNARTPAQLARATGALQAAAARGANPPLLIVVDQEGGDVRRLRWAPPQRSAAELGERPLTAARQGELAGRALRRVGINLDLAPVLDVPAVRHSFLGTRAFGRTPGAVARAACAFAAGVRRSGVLTTAKHFPGLGYARANTDDARVAIRAAPGRLRAAYRPYRACLGAGAVSTVMISNAAYPRLGARRPAVVSSAVVAGELRGRLGFQGVVVSDSLQARSVREVADLPAAAALAGVDLLVYPHGEAASAAAFRALLEAARSRPALRRRIGESAQRIRSLKAQLPGSR